MSQDPSQAEAWLHDLVRSGRVDQLSISDLLMFGTKASRRLPKPVVEKLYTLLYHTLHTREGNLFPDYRSLTVCPRGHRDSTEVEVSPDGGSFRSERLRSWLAEHPGQAPPRHLSHQVVNITVSWTDGHLYNVDPDETEEPDYLAYQHHSLEGWEPYHNPYLNLLNCSICDADWPVGPGVEIAMTND
jgi:hypothetical protein